MARIKEVSTLLEGRTENEVRIGLADIIRVTGDLPVSYEDAGAYLAIHKPFSDACADKHYEPVRVENAAREEMKSGRRSIDLSRALDYTIVLKRLEAIPTTPASVATASSSAAVPASVAATSAPTTCINYNKQYFYTSELRRLMALGLTVIHNANKPIVEMTTANIAIITPIINASYPPRAENIYRAECSRNGGTFPWADRVAVERFVKQINTDNSTRAPARSIDLIVNYILSPANRFSHRAEIGDVGLVDELTNYIVSHGGRREKSLASKVCKYTNLFYGFVSGTGCSDYFINDLFIRSMLPYYLDYYGIPHSISTRTARNKMTYAVLHSYLTRISTLSRLSPNYVDRIIWGCYKSYSAKG